MTKREQFEVYKAKKAQLLKLDKPIKYMCLKKAARPLLRTVLRVQRLINGNTIEFVGRNQVPSYSKPMVIAVSHIGKYDFEIVNEVISQHFHILASDFMNMYGNINGLFMQVNGVIYIDVEDRQDRENSRQMMLRVLESGDNMMIFPEGTWNISENEIIKDIHFGAVDIAMEKETVIVPIAVEQYQSRFVINIGDIFDPNEIKNVITDIPYSALSSENAAEKNIKYQIKQTATMELRDRLATLKYQIWEREGIERRENIPCDYWQHFIEERCREWTGYSMREQVINSYIPAWRREYNDMLSSIQQMRVSNANEFLFRK